MGSSSSGSENTLLALEADIFEWYSKTIPVMRMVKFYVLSRVRSRELSNRTVSHEPDPPSWLVKNQARLLSSGLVYRQQCSLSSLDNSQAYRHFLLS
jgi:hypothetical protein